MINKKISTIAGSLVIIAIATAIGFSFLVSNKKGEEVKNQNNIALNKSDLGNKEDVKQDEEKMVKDIQNEESEEAPIMEEVSFCGKNYNVEKIALNDVDVIKKIATLSQNNKYRICENIETNSPDKNLNVSINKQSTSAIDYGDGRYFMRISNLLFEINLNTNNIYVLGAYAGEPTFIGKLK